MREQTGVPLAGLTTLRVGGTAARLVVAETDEEVVEVVRAADAEGEPLLVLGGGSNLVVADDGFEGTVVQVATRGAAVAGGAEHAVELAAGADWDHAVALLVDEGYAGVEALAGIPGRVGAAPIQNIGAYGQEVAQTLARVRVLDRRTHDVVDLGPAECGFGYRDSMFKRDPDRYVVLGVTLALEHSRLGGPVRYAELARRLGVATGDRAPAAEVRDAVLALRRGKGMVLDPDDHDTWSAGSFFTNPLLAAADAARLPAGAPRWPERDGRVKTSAAWLIEQAGFGKGYGAGPAGISTKHTLALTNRGGASAEDLLALARVIRDGVRGRFGVELVHEPVLVGLRL